MKENIKKFLKDKGKLNICITKKRTKMEETINKLSRNIDLPVHILNTNNSDVFDVLQELRTIDRDVVVYLNDFDKVSPLKQLILMPFLDGRIKRTNSICVINTEQDICKTMIRTFDFVI